MVRAHQGPYLTRKSKRVSRDCEKFVFSVTQPQDSQNYWQPPVDAEPKDASLLHEATSDQLLA